MGRPGSYARDQRALSASFSAKLLRARLWRGLCTGTVSLRRKLILYFLKTPSNRVSKSLWLPKTFRKIPGCGDVTSFIPDASFVCPGRLQLSESGESTCISFIFWFCSYEKRDCSGRPEGSSMSRNHETIEGSPVSSGVRAEEAAADPSPGWEHLAPLRRGERPGHALRDRREQGTGSRRSSHVRLPE